jgi:hypothetical protein
MNTKLLLTFAAIAAMLGTVGVVGLHPASASTGDIDFSESDFGQSGGAFNQENEGDDVLQNQQVANEGDNDQEQ